MATATISAKIRWAEEDADGQECFCCGDKSYLFPALRMEMVLQPGGRVIKTNHTICAACFD